MAQTPTSIPIVACMNQKGGVGKTLVTGLLAEWFALIRNQRVLIVDLDMQCNTTDHWVGMDLAPNAIGGQLPPIHPDYNPEWEVNERSSVADIFYGTPILPYTTWLKNADTSEPTGFVDVLCGHPQKLEAINVTFGRADGHLDQRVQNRLKTFFVDPEIQESYDLILLDTGPSRSPIFRAAVRAASHVLIPFRPEEKDIQGITAMLQVIRQENYARPNANEKLKLIGLLPNMVRPTKLHEDNLFLLRKEHDAIMFPTGSWLSHLTAYPERDAKGSRPKSVFELPVNSLPYQQSSAMANYVERIILGETP